jgi:hypothetical protein
MARYRSIHRKLEVSDLERCQQANARLQVRPSLIAFLGTNVSVCEPEMPELSTKLPIST